MSLIEIARDMTRQARRSYCSQRELPRGLSLELVWVGGQKTLRLARPVVLPSAEEERLCRLAFEVPETAERNEDTNVITLRWAT